MKLFSKLLLVLFFTIVFIGCDSNKPKTDQQVKVEQNICPQCNMPLPDSDKYTAKHIKDNHTTYFDDIGCLILWAKEHDIDLKTSQNRVFTSDTKIYIDPFKVYFTINENTPMHYGFSAYEKKCEECITFDEVIIRMLRGEHMANPKIRKQILGY